MDANGLEPASVLLSPARSANVFTPSTDTIAASAPWDMKRATTSSVQPAPRPSRSRSARHESGTSAAQSGIHAHPMNLDGATPEPSKTVVPCKRYRGFESPPLRLGKPRIVCRDPVRVAGFSRPSGEFGGNSGANSPTVDGPKHTQRHRGSERPNRHGVYSPPLWLLRSTSLLATARPA